MHFGFRKHEGSGKALSQHVTRRSFAGLHLCYAVWYNCVFRKYAEMLWAFGLKLAPGRGTSTVEAASVLIT